MLTCQVVEPSDRAPTTRAAEQRSQIHDDLTVGLPPGVPGSGAQRHACLGIPTEARRPVGNNGPMSSTLLTDEVSAALAQFFYSGDGPSHATLTRCFTACGLADVDPYEYSA